jgi:BirA family biotin operon repressor/biotin-[acetyl-CoA-carboxylase] ligase
MTFAEFNEINIQTALGDLPLGGIRYYPKIGSTNDLALAWADEDGTDMSLVITDDQTAGRGRNGRKWFSQAGGSLIFSLLLKPSEVEIQSMGLFSALGTLAVAQAIEERAGGASIQIKWPNDVLVNKMKICGVLAEANWIGDRLESLVVGVGLNVSHLAVSPAESISFPAVSLEEVTCATIDRLNLLHAILKNILDWRLQLGKPAFLQALESRLAFQGEPVQVWSDHHSPIAGVITGLDAGGGLLLKDPDGRKISVCFGEVHLKPVGL